MLSCTPSWNSTENSLSPSNWASAAVALNAAAASAPIDPMSSVRETPVSASGWPLRSISNAAAHPESARNRPSTASMRTASASWITISWTLTRLPPVLDRIP